MKSGGTLASSSPVFPTLLSLKPHLGLGHCVVVGGRPSVPVEASCAASGFRRQQSSKRLPGIEGLRIRKLMRWNLLVFKPVFFLWSRHLLRTLLEVCGCPSWLGYSWDQCSSLGSTCGAQLGLERCGQRSAVCGLPRLLDEQGWERV